MGKQIVFIALLWLVTTASAQKPHLSFKQIDSTTYALYLKQDWKTMLAIGKQSRAEGIDFYHLKVRMGIAYFKENKMLSAIKFLEEAYAINSFDIVVQEYLYWAYHYSGLILESRLFYPKMTKSLQDKIKLDLPFATDLSFIFLANKNLDYENMLLSDTNSENADIRIIPKNYQLYSLGISHPLAKKANLYHQFSILPYTSVLQENIGGVLENVIYKANEFRYYVDVTIPLGNRWYLDSYLNIIFGNLNVGNTTTSKITYTDVLFGGSLTKASYFIRNSINVSVSNLNGLNQFQAGYTMSLYPFGSTLVVPFGTIQYQNQNPDSTIIFTGGLTVTIDKFLITGYGTLGDMNNFSANNGAIIYNQSATVLSEIGASFLYFGKNSIIKLGYSFMDMESHYTNENFELSTKTFEFKQQNIIAGITWKY